MFALKPPERDWALALIILSIVLLYGGAAWLAFQ